ncbi:MAG: hypothetical protein NZL85_06150 [Fimbriimonadales bacterium]|nr:hypothetical protein [Fimbriimonadales bacterium]
MPAMTRAALAAGADGVIIEVHPNPARALKDGAQSLTPDAFRELMRTLHPLAEVMERRL